MLLNCGIGEDSWESLDYKEIQPVHPKGNQSWMYFGRTDVEAETLVLWPPHAKSWLIWKDPDARKDWRQEEKGTTEDEMVGWHHQLNGHEFGWTPGVGDGQGSQECCSSWGCKELDMTEWLNWTEHVLNFFFWMLTCIIHFILSGNSLEYVYKHVWFCSLCLRLRETIEYAKSSVSSTWGGLLALAP